METTINSGLESISDWGSQNLVTANASRTQFLPVSLSNNRSYPQISFDGDLMKPLPAISHIDLIAKSALMKRGVLISLS